MHLNSFSSIVVGLTLALSASAMAQTGETSESSNSQSSSGVFPRVEAVRDQAGLRPHVGAKLGVANPEGSYDTSAEMGLDIGFQPYVPFGVGLAIATSSNPSETSAKDLERTSVLARGTYNFGGSTIVLKDSWVGVAAGPVFRNDGTDLGVAPIVGFDIPILENERSHFTLGADAKYLALVNSDESDSLTLSGALKYWF